MNDGQIAELINWGQGVGFAVCFIGFWCLVCYSMSWVCGWHALARQYRLKQEFAGEQWRFRSGKMRRNTNFGNCLTIGANRDGLYLAVLFLFRVGMPPLFIPWSEITFRRERRWFMRRIRFTLGNETQIPLWINQRLGDRILERHPEGIGEVQDIYARPGTEPPRKLV